MARELGQGVLPNASSPTVNSKRVLTLPPVPSRIAGKHDGGGGSQGNVPQGAISYISSVPQAPCPDMEIFRGDASYMTDVSSVDGGSDGISQDEEELPDEAVPHADELVGS